MRKLTQIVQRRRRRRDERGAAAVIVGIFTVVLVGAAAISIDLGNARAVHRKMNTGSDAAALAAAEDFAAGNTTGCTVAETVAQLNDPDVTVTCSTSNNRLVTVKVEKAIDYQFAGALGFDARSVSSTTTARYDFRGVEGVRPFAMCIHALFEHPDIIAWDHRSVLGPTRITFGGQSQVNSCGGAAGNWGSLDFNGGNNNTNDQEEWTLNGWSGEIQTGAMQGDPGANAIGNVLNNELQHLVNTSEVFPMAVFDTVTASGGNTELELIGFVKVQIYDFHVTGNGNNRWMEFYIYPGESDWPGITCCDPNGPPVSPVQICGQQREDDAC